MLLFEKDEKRVEPIDLITITKEEYADLLTEANKWQMIHSYFYETAEVKYADWDNSYYVSASGDDLNKAMQIMDAQRYKEFKDAGINKISE